MASKGNLTVVLDIGTSKMVAIAGYKNETGDIEVSGIAKTFSKGIKRGIVFNIEEVAATIKKLLKELESNLKQKISEVSIAYSGQHFKTIDYQCTKITSDEGVVSRFDIDHLYNEAQKAEVEPGFKIIKVIPKSFVIDNEIELNPIGITGRQVVANYKLVVLPEEYLLNLNRVFEKAEVELSEIVLSTLAVSEAVLTNDEKEMGVIVLDLGAGTSNMAMYHESMLIHTAVIPFGGEVISRDIKEGCSILLKWAEQLKIQYGQALGDFADDQKVVTIPSHNGWEPKEISFKSLAFIIQARAEEIVDTVYKQIEKSEIQGQLGAGIVLTGGTSNLENIVSLVKFRTGMDARKAKLTIHIDKKNNELQNPENYTALGLLNLILNRTDQIHEKIPNEHKVRRKPGRFTPWITNIVQGVLDLVDDENEDVALN